MFGYDASEEAKKELEELKTRLPAPDQMRRAVEEAYWYGFGRGQAELRRDAAKILSVPGRAPAAGAGTGAQLRRAPEKRKAVPMKGVGVILQELGGNEESAKAFSSSIGKKIADVRLQGDYLVFKFEDGSGLKISDHGQSCCESRYMNCDDDLTAFKGATLLSGEVREAQEGEREREESYNFKDCQFLIIKTDKGDFTVANYNEHNGYYGGFSIRAEAME